MKRRRILVQWIGNSDLRAMAAALPLAKADTIRQSFNADPSPASGQGLTKTLLSNESFDEVHLLSNFDPKLNKWFRDWLAVPATMVPVELNNPTDYVAIFNIADRELGKLKQAKSWSETELCLHLSPGTPAMTAVWVLLGKTRYPASFYETSRDGKSWITTIPFELLDVIPEVLKKPDVHLQHLAFESPSEIEGFEDIVGDSRAIRDAVGRSRRVAMRSVSVLLLGESGTGKEMFAQAIHKASPRRAAKPFKAINCAALSKTLLESELFGHAKGAFTGADKLRKGAFEFADGGTLFLDEVGECDLETQAKLLRVLQPVTGDGPAIRKVCRLGDEQEHKVDVRIIAATNRDLHQAITEGRFREDLYYRLAAMTITLPPLRDRKSDIALIAKRLLGQLNQQFEWEDVSYEHKTLSASAISFVKTHPWPGNVRQLYNVLVQASVLAEGKEISKQDLAAAIGEMPASSGLSGSLLDRTLGDGFDLEELLNSIHRHYLQRAMDEAGGIKSKASELLGMRNYQTLDAQLKRLNAGG